MPELPQPGNGHRSRRRRLIAPAAVIVAAALSGLTLSAAVTRPTLVTEWSDEFDGPAGSAPDPAIWTFQVGDGGWGNHELQTYTDRNAWLDGDSHLVIAAKIDTDAAGRTEYTSSRLTTAGKLTVTYGTLEARIRLPDGHGLLPAFWLLGDTLGTAGWPAAGEIDVVETPFSTGTSSHHLHAASTGDPTVDRQVAADVVHTTPLSDGFHVYSVTRSPGRVTVRVDEAIALDVTRASAPADLDWAFDRPFQVLLNIAIGGDWPGAPDASTPAVSEMIVDWIRVRPAG